MRAQYHIVLTYFTFGIFWILVSDGLVGEVYSKSDQIVLAQSIKGLFFMAFTSLLLFFLIRKSMSSISKVKDQVLFSYDQTIHGWVRVMDLRHKETTDHTKRVTAMSLKLAQLAGISDSDELKGIERGATLHDIGKIGIPDSILIKPGKLDNNEWHQMQKHTEIAKEILSDIDFLQKSMDIPYYHHEKWDGTGYPKGLKQQEIPYSARLFAVIDVWDALIHPRVYKAAWPEERVLEHIESESGKHFDPHVVELFLNSYDEVRVF